MALECIRIVVGHFSGGGNWDLCARMCGLCVGVFVCLVCALYALCALCVCMIVWVC